MDSLLTWLQKQVDTVPPHLAICEFHCSKSQCRYRDWEACTLVPYARPSRGLPLTTLTDGAPRSPATYADA